MSRKRKIAISVEQFANEYNQISRRSHRPLLDMAERHGVSQSTVKRRVQEAKCAGLINADTQSGTNPYLAAICEELGIELEVMERAIKRHAPNGNLRVTVGR